MGTMMTSCDDETVAETAMLTNIWHFQTSMSVYYQVVLTSLILVEFLMDVLLFCCILDDLGLPVKLLYQVVCSRKNLKMHCYQECSTITTQQTPRPLASPMSFSQASEAEFLHIRWRWNNILPHRNIAMEQIVRTHYALCISLEVRLPQKHLTESNLEIMI